MGPKMRWARKRSIDELQQAVFAEIDPLLSRVNFGGCALAIALAVAAGVVAVAFAGLALHRDRLVASAAA
jgi:hypothetical protein